MAPAAGPLKSGFASLRPIILALNFSENRTWNDLESGKSGRSIFGASGW